MVMMMIMMMMIIMLMLLGWAELSAGFLGCLARFGIKFSSILFQHFNDSGQLGCLSRFGAGFY